MDVIENAKDCQLALAMSKQVGNKILMFFNEWK